MTDQEINIAIAECCGWKENGLGPKGTLHHPTNCTCFDGAGCWIPNYTFDLNAMHTAESIFDGKICDERSLWLDHLSLVVGWKNSKKPVEARFECTYLTARASARQRAEAFLRTLGKWKE